MPNYSRYNDPTEQYQGTAFNPYTGRLSGANIVMEFLARAAGEKERKKKESTEAEDREWQKLIRELQKTQAEQGIAKGQQEIAGYEPPPVGRFFKGEEAKAEQAGKIEIERVRGEETRKTWAERDKAIEKERLKNEAALKKAYSAAKTKIESTFTKNLTDIETKFTTDVAAIRKDKNLTAIQVSTGPSPYLVAIRGAMAAKTRMKKELATRKAQELEWLRDEYSAGLELGKQDTIPPDVLAAARKARPDLSDEEIISAWQARKK